MPRSCITIQSVYYKKQVFPAACVIEKDVEVNIMRFRTLFSIEFQGSCSRDVNLGHSQNCIFGICDQSAFWRCFTRASLDLSVEVNGRFFQLHV